MNPAVVHLRRELKFQPLVACDMAGTITGVVSAIAIAIFYRSAWALVLAAIAAQAASTATSYVVGPYRPRWAFDWAKARELRSFGKWIFWFNVAAFLSENVDGLAVGKLVGTTALGLYQVAYQLALFPSAQMRPVVVNVMLPAFARIDDTNDLRHAFLKTLTVAAAILVPAACFITVFADPLVLWILGEQWRPITLTTRVLAWVGVSLGLTSVTIPLFHALGRPDIPARAFAVRVVLSAALLYPLTVSYGIVGAASAITVAGFGAIGYELARAARVLAASPWAVVERFGIAAAACVPFVAALSFLPSQHVLLVIPLAAAAIMVSMGIVLLSFGLPSVLGWGPGSPLARTVTSTDKAVRLPR